MAEIYNFFGDIWDYLRETYFSIDFGEYRNFDISGYGTTLAQITLGVIIGISGLLGLAVDTNFLIIAAFASCTVIFVYPLFLLGTVTPSLVKYAMESMDDSGRTVGRMEAFNTVGSILGTFLPTFVTIPAVGTSITFYIFAALLFLLGDVYFIAAHTK